MKIVIAQRGPSNAGKSSTIRAFYAMLREAYPDATITHQAGGARDFRAVVAIGETRIGIESMGDPGHRRQGESLRLFVTLGCVAIVCATRTSGGTVALVTALAQDGYEVTWRERGREGAAAQSQANQTEAKWMLDRVQTLIETA